MQRENQVARSRFKQRCNLFLYYSHWYFINLLFLCPVWIFTLHVYCLKLHEKIFNETRTIVLSDIISKTYLQGKKLQLSFFLFPTLNLPRKYGAFDEWCSQQHLQFGGVSLICPSATVSFRSRENNLTLSDPETSPTNWASRLQTNLNQPSSFEANGKTGRETVFLPHAPKSSTDAVFHRPVHFPIWRFNHGSSHRTPFLDHNQCQPCSVQIHTW